MPDQSPSPDSHSSSAAWTPAAAADLLRELADCLSFEELLRRHPALRREDLQRALMDAANALAPPLLSSRTPVAKELPTLAPPSEMATLPPTRATEDGPPDQPMLARRSIPGYELLDEIGRGGMGVVYKARHLALNRVVALKMILAGEHASEEMVDRFKREAEAVAQLTHPGIVQIYEIGEHGEQRFLALEYVGGGSLAARLKQGPLPAEEAARLVEKLAIAMHVAHERGIVHRDLKPENVLLSADGEPRITDFGLARRLEDTGGKTQTGAILGTPSYMAPEQAAGKKAIGPAADVYALGAILYALLTGRPPFEGPTTVDILLRVMEDEPVPVRQCNPAVRRDLETITMKCLRKEPGKRYESAKALAGDLRRYLDRDPILARRQSRVERTLHWVRRHPGMTTVRLLGILICSPLPVGLFLSWNETGRLFGGLGLLIALVFLGFVLRAPARSTTIGTLIGGGIALILAIGLWMGTYQLIRVVIGFPSEPVPDFLWALAILPLPVGLVIGALVRQRWWVILGAAALVTILSLLLGPHDSSAWAFSVPVSLFGLCCRLMCYWRGGNLVDIMSSAVLGGGVGVTCCGSVVTLVLSIAMVRAGARGDMPFFGPTGPIGQNMVFIVTGLIGVLIGSFLGACASARASRRESLANEDRV
jgi:hypothetical protein